MADLSQKPKAKAGRKSAKQAKEHEAMIQHTMEQFFGVGQSLPLYPFCESKGVQSCYDSIRRRINSNTNLKNVQAAQSMTVGFTVRQSTSALNIISAVSSASPKDLSPMECVPDIGCNPDVKSARKSPVPLKEELVTAIQDRQQVCWDNNLKQDDKRKMLLEDEEFEDCSDILFLLPS